MNFAPNKPKKGYFQSKNKKYEIRHRIQHILISLVSKFQLQQITLIFGANYQKRVLPVENRKNKHHQLIPHIPKYQISAHTDNFDFLDKICPKGFPKFPLQNLDKRNTATELSIFELV